MEAGRGLSLTSPAEGGELRTHPWVMLWEGCLQLALQQCMVVGIGISRTRGVPEWRGTKVSEPWKRCVPNTRTVSSSALMGRLWASTSLGRQEFREPRLREAAGAADPGSKARDLRLRPGPASAREQRQPSPQGAGSLVLLRTLGFRPP